MCLSILHVEINMVRGNASQKIPSEDGERFLHGVESTPVGLRVQIPSETSSCYLVELSTC